MKARYVILALALLFIGPAVNASDGLDPTQTVNLMTQGLHPLTMHADLDTMTDGVKTDGELDYVVWSDQYGAKRETFGATLLVTIPSKLPGFENVASARDADMRLRLSHHGNDYAECRLVVDPVVSRHFVVFSFQVMGYNDDAKPVRGVCDVDLLTDGVQLGVPSIDQGVMITAFVKTDHAGDCDFAQGYCE